MDEHLTPEPILQLGLAFWGSKTLLSAVELGLFTHLAAEPRTAETIAADLDLHLRGINDFLDALVSNPRLYPFWGSLTEALRTAHPQNEAKVGENFFTSLYEDPNRLEQFLHTMTGISMGDARALGDSFPWDQYQTVIDIGTAEGCVPVELALRHPHLSGGGFDLPAVAPIFDKHVAGAGLSDPLRFHAGDFFADPLPAADVLVMGHVLHDWGLDEKLMLLRKAYDALPPGGALIVYESIIDDDRRTNTFGLLMSLNMLIETQSGFDFTGADCQSWMTDVGFEETYVEPLAVDLTRWS